MIDDVIMIGNGVNNLTNKGSWKNLLNSMVDFCKVCDRVEQDDQKPFPLLYEEIYLKSVGIGERKLKEFISEQVKVIKKNKIHDMVMNKGLKDIITTNYEYTLQGCRSGKRKLSLKNQGMVRESKFSVFRHNRIDDTNVWHIHGECNIPDSITLGYEHYGGQMQQMRNYMVSGTHYTKKKDQRSLVARLRTGDIYFESWIDLFFTKNIHIIGLALDFIETDIWWLLAYRARVIKSEKVNVPNRIIYYTPKKYANKNKIELMKSVNIDIVEKNKDGFGYYQDVLESIR